MVLRKSKVNNVLLLTLRKSKVKKNQFDCHIYISDIKWLNSWCSIEALVKFLQE